MAIIAHDAMPAHTTHDGRQSPSSRRCVTHGVTPVATTHTRKGTTVQNETISLDAVLVQAAGNTSAYFYHAPRANGKGLAHAFAASMLGQPVMISERAKGEDAPCMVVRLVSLSIDASDTVVVVVRDAKGRTREYVASEYDVRMYRGEVYAQAYLPLYYKRAGVKRQLLAAGASEAQADAIIGKMPAQFKDAENLPTLAEALNIRDASLDQLTADAGRWIATYGTKTAKTPTGKRTSKRAVSLEFDDEGDTTERDAVETADHDELEDALA